jgi:hypothetical protein
MEKITLKLYDFLNLEADINGVVDQRTGERVRKGLLQYPLPMGVKYWITKLAKAVAEEKTIIDGLKDELVKKYGTEKDNSIIVAMTLDDLDEKGKPIKIKVKNAEGEEVEINKQIINPQYLAFEKEYSEVLQQEKELEYRPISLSELVTHDHPNGLETEETYETFFKLVTPPTE